MDEEKTVVGDVEKRLLGRHQGKEGDFSQVSARDYEALLIGQAERAAARLRASRLARRPAGAETGGNAAKGSEVA